MKQSKFTKAMALMLSLVMITSVFVGNTLSRYVTSVSSTDSARVAIWGINGGTTTMNLFKADYIKDGKSIAASNNAATNPEDKIMAPGTSGEAPFSIINFEQDVAPEVAYQVSIQLDDSQIADEIRNNPSVQWKLDEGSWGTLEQLKTSILSLSGDASGVKVYEPGKFADAFEDNTPHTIAWQWLLDNNETIMDNGVAKTSNEYDTYMGNLALAGDLEAVITVGITATQIDDLVTNANMLDGMNQVINANDIQPAVFRSAAPSSELQEVKVNNETVDPSNYDVEEGSTIITLHKDFLETLDTGSHTIDIVSASMTASTRFFVEDAPIVHGGVIPEGGTYYVGVTTDSPMVNDYTGATAILTAGQEFPELNESDVYVYGDYEYRYNAYFEPASMQWFKDESNDGWGVRVLDNSKSFYGNILTSINDKDVVSMGGTFFDCTSLVDAPVIPSSVTDMNETFVACASLVNAPVIPNSVTNMSNAFADCASLVNAPVIPDSVTNMGATFMGCRSLQTAPVIPSSVKSMGSTFAICPNLTGDVEINANPTDYGADFIYTEKPIILTGTSTMLNEIASASMASNVTVASN